MDDKSGLHEQNYVLRQRLSERRAGKALSIVFVLVFSLVASSWLLLGTESLLAVNEDRGVIGKVACESCGNQGATHAECGSIT